MSGCAATPSRAPLDEPVTVSTGATVKVDGDTTLAIPPSEAPVSAIASPAAETTTFAIIGDYGADNWSERRVAAMVASWRPAFIVTTGDNYALNGSTGTRTFDRTVGAYYVNWLKGISTDGTHAPVGLAPVNAFFPTIGNHDYLGTPPSLDAYLTYFTLPGEGFTNTSGNERYYDFVEGPIHFFILNSNPAEPDGIDAKSRQAQWLRQQLAASTARWNIVVLHAPPYSSGSQHGSSKTLQWPFAKWGASAVISGHAHDYERIERDGIVYFVNALGGAREYDLGIPVDGSFMRFDTSWGAQKVTVTNDALVFEFRTIGGKLIDRYVLRAKRP